MPATLAAKTPLQARFGHEEEFDRHIANQHMLQILSELGVAAIGSPEFQVTVPHGDDGKRGRIDIVQNTTAGAVIVENQYGTSDSYHFRKLSGYAKSIRNTFCVVWIAESFRAEHPEAAFRLPFPAWCIKAAPKGRGVALEPLRPAAEALQLHADRIKLCSQREAAFWRTIVAEYKWYALSQGVLEIKEYCERSSSDEEGFVDVFFDAWLAPSARNAVHCGCEGLQPYASELPSSHKNELLDFLKMLAASSAEESF